MKHFYYAYFLALKKYLVDSIQFSEIFHKNNYNCWSIAYAKMLLSTCVEIESTLKEISKRYDPDLSIKRVTIGRLRSNVIKHKPNFHATEVQIPRYGKTLKPWEKWSGNPEQNPEWWQAYNNIKHESFSGATQRNVVNSIAALFVNLIYLYADETHPHEEGSPFNSLYPRPTLFSYPNLYPGSIVFGEKILLP